MTQRDSQLGPFDFGAEEGASRIRSSGGRGWLKVLLLIIVVLGAGAAYLWHFEPERATKWLEKAPVVGGPGVTTAYKWKDEDGNWQITDEPPPEGISYQTIEVRSDVNILPSLKQGNQ